MDNMNNVFKVVIHRPVRLYVVQKMESAKEK